jgi:hypothetical protein
MRSRPRHWRRIVSVLTAGCLFQIGGCTLSDESLAALVNHLVIREAANFLSDTVFFLLDNALVRWTG